MDICDFKAGEYRQQYEYSSFSPARVNHGWEISDGPVQRLLSEVDLVLGELNAFFQLAPDVDFFIR